MIPSLALTPQESLAKLYADCLIAAHGKASLAAEFITRSQPSSNPTREHDVLTVMAQHPMELARVGAALRVSAVLHLFEMQAVVHEELVNLINESALESSDIARLYSSLTHEIMTANHTTTTIQIDSPEQRQDDHFSTLLERLPPEVRRAVVLAADTINSVTTVQNDNHDN